MTNPERAEMIMVELEKSFNEIGMKYHLERDALMLMLKSMADGELLAMKGKGALQELNSYVMANN